MRGAERRLEIAKRAEALASSGAYSDWQAIEKALYEQGCRQARSVLRNMTLRRHLNRICARCENGEVDKA